MDSRDKRLYVEVSQHYVHVKLMTGVHINIILFLQFSLE
jgi:hypothetical protein